MTEKVISYSEFMNMSVFDFDRLEAVFVFRHEMANNKNKRTKVADTRAKLSNLPTVDARSLGFTDEQIKGLKNG